MVNEARINPTAGDESASEARRNRLGRRFARFFRRVSMRTSLIATVLTLGALGLALTFAGAAVYRDLAIEQQRAVLTDYLRSEFGALRRDLTVRAQWLGEAAQNDAGLIAALGARDERALARRLGVLAQHHERLLGEVAPAQLQAYDAKLNILAHASRPQDLSLAALLCANWRAPAAKVAPGIRAPLSGFCLQDGLHYAVLIPLGREAPVGYLQVVMGVERRLGAMQAGMALPLELRMVSGRVLHQLGKSPAPDTTDEAIVVEHAFSAHERGRAMALKIAALKDMSDVHAGFAQARYFILFVAVLLTVAFMFVALVALQKTAIEPLRALAERLRGVRRDVQAPVHPVPVRGTAEVAELVVEFNAMIAGMRELRVNMDDIAFTDPLTQLPNRAMFLDRLRQTIHAAKREHRPFALIIMDLDHFKDINDTLGHHIGDLLLEQVAERLRDKLRDSDMVARLGGDEFAVLLSAVSVKQAETAARMLLQTLRSPFVFHEHHLDISASIGIVLHPDHGVEANVLLQRADVAMYAAKTANSGFAFYDTKMDQHYGTRLALLSELRQAIEQEQFTLCYQPKVNLASGRVEGVEALVRWNHPREGVIPPDAFISLLEQTGQIRNLTPWVLNEAMQQSARLRRMGFPVSVAVNLSVCDLQDPSLADTIAEQLAAHQVEPAWLELEITESAVMTDPARALDMLARLSAMGLKLTIDDFGTGYSSLSYLKRLPVDAIKIDKTFVTGMIKDENDAAIVRTSVELAHHLGLEVVAEGAESEAVYRRLRELGCDLAQGLFLSRPLSPEDLEVWLAQRLWGMKKSGKDKAARVEARAVPLRR